MPALPRPFLRRRPTPPGAIGPVRPAESRPARRVVPPPAAEPARRPVTEAPSVPRRGLMDRLFAPKPGTPVPPWTRVINMIVFMAIVWEGFSFLYTYYAGINLFGGRMAAHNLTAAWQSTVVTMPFALALATLGSVPGFWFMRTRIQRANRAQAEEQALRRAQARPAPAEEPRSSRARRRQAAKKEHGRRR